MKHTFKVKIYKTGINLYVDFPVPIEIIELFTMDWTFFFQKKSKGNYIKLLLL